MALSRIVEELFPFPYYLVRKARQWRRCTSEGILNEAAFTGYNTLSSAQLTKRLEEERGRATAMDEKTFKLTLSLSVGLTVLGSTAAFLVKTVSPATVQTALAVMIGLGLLYVLAAGFVALGALRTFQSYGYGTHTLQKAFTAAGGKWSTFVIWAKHTFTLGRSSPRSAGNFGSGGRL